MMSLSRIIRSYRANTEEVEAREIKIQKLFEDVAQEQPMPQLSLSDIQSERQKMLHDANVQIEDEKQAFEAYKQAALMEIEAAKQAWEDERPQHVQAAYDEGFAQGYDEGMQKATAAMQADLAQANALIQLAEQNATRYLEEQENVILSLALQAASRIIDQQLADHAETFLSIVQRGLKEAREMKEIKIYVAPAYYELLTVNREELSGIFPPDVPFLIFVLEELEETECYIETNHGRIVVSIDEQLNELRHKLFELLNNKE